MKNNEIKIDDEVYAVRQFGTFRDGFDIQIVKYKVQYKGKIKFVPYGFQCMVEKYQEVPYDICLKTLEEAKQEVRSMLTGSIEFVERYRGNYYDVKFKEEE